MVLFTLEMIVLLQYQSMRTQGYEWDSTTQCHRYSLSTNNCICVFFFRTLFEFFAQCQVFRAISGKASEKILLIAQQYACGGSMLINLTKIWRVPFCN